MRSIAALYEQHLSALQRTRLELAGEERRDYSMEQLEQLADLIEDAQERMELLPQRAGGAVQTLACVIREGCTPQDVRVQFRQRAWTSQKYRLQVERDAPTMSVYKALYGPERFLARHAYGAIQLVAEWRLGLVRHDRQHDQEGQ